MERSTQFRFESLFERTLGEVWSVLSDTNRLNELEGTWEPYTAVDKLEPDGSVLRHARGRLGPFRVEWTEGFGEWVEKRYSRQGRHFKNGPVRSLVLEAQVTEEGDKVRVSYTFTAIWDSMLGDIVIRLGVLKKASKAVVVGIEAGVAALERSEAWAAAAGPPGGGGQDHRRFGHGRVRNSGRCGAGGDRHTAGLGIL